MAKISSTPEGIEVDKLMGSYAGIEDDIEVNFTNLHTSHVSKDLVEERKVVQITDAESKENVLYPNDSRFFVELFPGIACYCLFLF